MVCFTCIQTVNRLFFCKLDNVKLSKKETRKLNEFDDKNKKFMARRKTILKFLFFAVVFPTILNFILKIYLTDFNTHKYSKVLIGIDLSTSFISFLKCLMMGFALYYWNDYKKSSTFMFYAFVFYLIVPMAYLLIPYFEIIDVTHADNFSLMKNIADNILTLLLPFLSLNKTFINSMFKINEEWYNISSLTFSTYLTIGMIPICMLLVIFSLAINLKLIEKSLWIYGYLFVISYFAMGLLKLKKNKYTKYANYIILASLLVSLWKILSHYDLIDYQILSHVFNFAVSYIMNNFITYEIILNFMKKNKDNMYFEMV